MSLSGQPDYRYYTDTIFEYRLEYLDWISNDYYILKFTIAVCLPLYYILCIHEAEEMFALFVLPLVCLVFCTFVHSN